MSVGNTLVLLAKTPSAGRVKTRLARDIGVAQALRFYRHQLARTVRSLSNHPHWQLVLCRSPDFQTRSAFPAVDMTIGQGDGDLGERMQRVFDKPGKFVHRGPVIIIGADIPGITPGMIKQAFHLLKNQDVVFGPAPDGGYWLVGQRRRPHVIKLFANVRWSSENTLNDTLYNIEGCSVGFVNELNDIDVGADLKKNGIIN